MATAAIDMEVMRSKAWELKQMTGGSPTIYPLGNELNAYCIWVLEHAEQKRRFESRMY